jgi:subtilisin family serine protease
VDREIYQQSYATLPIVEYTLQLLPELVPVTDINVLADEIATLYGVNVFKVYDTPCYKAMGIKGISPDNKVFSDQRFVDYNQANATGVGEMQVTAGHVAQLNEDEPLNSTQILPFSVQRTILNMTADAIIGGINRTIIPLNTTTINATAVAVDSGSGSEQISCEVAKKPSDTLKEGEIGVDVAVLDTGISLIHPDLNVVNNVSFVDGVTSGDDDVGHGSHIAGIIGAKDNSFGVVGVAPGARLWAVKVCDNLGQCKISDQIEGVEYAIKHADEIDVLNISIENPNSNALNNVITEAVRAGITVVVSAGNYGSDASSTTPANNPNVLTVSAIGDSDGKCGGEGPPLVGRRGEVTDDSFAYFSNFGPTVKVAAPGVEIFSTYNGTGYAVDTGTSMAAPHVAGAAALYIIQYPDASPSEVMTHIEAEGSLPTSACDGGPNGYFTGDPDSIPEPLVFEHYSPVSLGSNRLDK